MKKTLLVFVMLLAVLFTSNSIFLPQRTTASALSSSADSVESSAEKEISLLMPSSYEQYLQLQNPSDFAVNDKYIAVADRTDSGSVLYIYDREKNVYLHTNGEGNALKSLSFYTDAEGNTYLYYVNSTTFAYRIDLSADTLESTEIPGFTCYSMTILGDTVYFARTQSSTATVYSSNVGSITDATAYPNEYDCNNPNFSVYNGKAYLAINNIVYMISGDALIEKFNHTENDISSFAVYDDISFAFYYTTSGNSIFDTHLDKETSFPATASTVKYYGNAVYFLSGETTSIQKIDCSSSPHVISSYEIGKYSTSVNRLAANASDVSSYGEMLLIADTENDRVLQCNLKTGEYTEILSGGEKDTAPDFASPQILCAGEDAFVVSDRRNLAVYSYEGEELARFDSGFGANIESCAYSYGKFFVVTSGTQNNVGILSPSENGYSLTIKSISLSATSVTADIYGNLYVFQNSSVYRYDSAAFGDGVAGVPVFAAPTDTLKILSDFDGNVYAVTKDGLYLLRENEVVSVVSTADTKPLLYDLASADFVSFAFSFEDNTISILSDGCIFTADLAEYAPKSLTALDSGNLYDALNGAVSEQAAQAPLVQIPDKAVLISLDAKKIEAQASLPYTSYSRAADTYAGVFICEIENVGSVVALLQYTLSGDPYDVEPQRTYTLCLVLENDLDPVDGCVLAAEFSVGYTSNKIPLYSFPTVQIGTAATPASQILEKSAKVSVLYKISYPASSAESGYGLDSDYYFVKVGSGDTAAYGFIPAQYLNDFSTSETAATSQYTFRNVKKNKSITLANRDDPSQSITLSDRERVKVYGSADENNQVYVTYTDKNDGSIVWEGLVDADLLYEASPSILIVLAVVLVASAVVIINVCYLLLRRQPTLQ